MEDPNIKNEQSSTTGRKHSEQGDLPGGSGHPIDASQGSEFMDDAIRTIDLPLDMFMQYPGEILQ